MLKICSKCKLDFEISSFSKDRSKKDGFRSWCKKCDKEQSRKYIIKNKEKIRNYHKKYSIENKEKIKKYGKEWREKNKERVKNTSRKNYEDKRKYYLEKHKEYNRKNKEKINKHFKERRRTDLNYRIKKTLRARIWNSLNNKDKSLSSMKLIGCSIEELKQHLEKQFKEGMTWENYGEWHIDHIIPCSLFNLLIEEEQKKCFHYSNLQPLWAEENIKKGAKLSES